MHRMIRPLLLCLPATALCAQDLPSGFGWFSTMAGHCWVSQFPDGKTEHTQCYTNQFGKFLRGTAALATIKDGARQVVFEGDSVFAWDEASKRVVYYIWGSDGSHRRLHANYVADELYFAVPTRADPTRISYRTVWRRLDADTIEIRRERPEGEQWSIELTVTYRKRPFAGETKK